LTSVTFPNSVTSIGQSAFSGCGGLTEIHSQNPTPPSDSGAFSGVNQTTNLYVPEGTYQTYWLADGWSEFTNIIEGDGEPEQPVHVSGITLDKNSLTLETGSTSQLTATVLPADATVSVSGLVSAIAAGQATITVTMTDGSKTTTCAVTVAPEDSVTVKDSVIYNIIYKDSVVYNIIPKDSIHYTIKERDSIMYDITVRDSIIKL
jgi:hypothetical protein